MKAIFAGAAALAFAVIALAGPAVAEPRHDRRAGHDGWSGGHRPDDHRWNRGDWDRGHWHPGPRGHGWWGGGRVVVSPWGAPAVWVPGRWWWNGVAWVWIPGGWRW
jgi:hypothetical protein